MYILKEIKNKFKRDSYNDICKILMFLNVEIRNNRLKEKIKSKVGKIVLIIEEDKKNNEKIILLKYNNKIVFDYKEKDGIKKRNIKNEKLKKEIKDHIGNEIKNERCVNKTNAVDIINNMKKAIEQIYPYKKVINNKIISTKRINNYIFVERTSKNKEQKLMIETEIYSKNKLCYSDKLTDSFYFISYIDTIEIKKIEKNFDLKIKEILKNKTNKTKLKLIN